MHHAHQVPFRSLRLGVVVGVPCTTCKVSAAGKVAHLDIELLQTPAPVAAPITHAHLLRLVVQLSRTPRFASIQRDLDSFDLETRTRVCVAAYGVCAVVVEAHQLPMARMGDNALDIEVVDDVVCVFPGIQCSCSHAVVDVRRQNTIVVKMIVVVGLRSNQKVGQLLKSLMDRWVA